MDDADREIRNTSYGLFVELGRAPTAAEVAKSVHTTPEQVREAWRRLHEAHALVVDPVSDEIRMANPFAA
jgi:DNA-directed RNA polymerase sigma subunit (sigma70/sigma32)